MSNILNPPGMAESTDYFKVLMINKNDHTWFDNP